jgi:ankyrin repeat protein
LTTGLLEIMLSKALWHDNEGLIRLLLPLLGDINAFIQPNLHTALTIAATRGNQTIVQSILDAGANPDHSAGSHTPLQIAIYYGHRDVAQLLIKHGADVLGQKGFIKEPGRRGFEDVVK